MNGTFGGVAVRIRVARREDCQNLGEVIVGANRAAFDGRVPEQCLLALPVSTSVANWKRAFDSGAFDSDEQVLLVAEAASDGVVAFVLAGGYTAKVFRDRDISDMYPREIVSLHVAPGWQHRGVGRSLIGASADWLIARQAKTLAVRVLELNPNRAFYARLGAQELGLQPYDWAGFATREVIYGWPDISRLRRFA
ncbi:MAG TPA: GNAT family N-acetyltransferase [Thermoflexales bacterium]|nr:GNAT family N-acetyltransferase [Thermoflexales bacterium]